MSEQKPEKKVVARSVAVALGIICIILSVGLVGAIVNYTSLQSVSRSTNGLKTVRLYEPSEMMTNTSKRIVLTWKPSDPTNNAIIYATTYFQYATSDGAQLGCSLVIGTMETGLNTVTGGSCAGDSHYRWSKVFVLSSTFTYMANQGNYTFGFSFSPMTYGLPVYVKNLNIVLEVIDGPPPS